MYVKTNSLLTGPKIGIFSPILQTRLNYYKDVTRFENLEGRVVKWGAKSQILHVFKSTRLVLSFQRYSFMPSKFIQSN